MLYCSQTSYFKNEQHKFEAEFMFVYILKFLALTGNHSNR